MPAVIVILRSRKPAGHRGKILFINAVDQVAREQAKSFLRESHQTKILDAYESFADVEGFAAVATIEQVADKGYSLAIPLYVAGTKSSDGSTGTVDVATSLSDWRRASQEADSAVIDVLDLLRKEVSA